MTDLFDPGIPPLKAPAAAISAQGSDANKTGQSLEQYVRSFLPRHYVILSPKQRKVLTNGGLAACSTVANGSPFIAGRIVIAGLTSIYEVNWQQDIFGWHPEKMPTGFAGECKFQQTSGSVDEKAPFSVLSLERLRNRCGVGAVFFSLDVAGYRQCACDWIARECHVRSIPYFTRTSEFAAFARMRL